MRVLVAFASKRGGTEGIAETIATEFREQGFTVDVKPCSVVRSVSGFDALVVGGALYAMRWHKDAKRFVRRFKGSMHGRPVWLFSSGPLDASATTKKIPPVRAVKRYMAVVGARGHETFGGRLVPHPDGALARRMAVKMTGDWRDDDAIRAWARSIAADLAPVASGPQ